MFDLNLNRFLEVLQNIRELKIRIETMFSNEARQNMIQESLRETFAQQFWNLGGATSVIHALLASKAANRMAEKLRTTTTPVSIDDIRRAIEDIESRMHDECEEIAVLVLSKDQKKLFHSTADEIANWNISTAYPDAAREFEEASKCFALGRATASVFHAMRMLEIGLKAFSIHLGIDSPSKPADKNWGRILGTIKSKIDETHPKNKRMPGSLGADYEAIYTSLDAVKNPWRNATMHVDAFYQDTEASHILNNVVEFLKLLNKTLVPIELPFGNSDQVNSSE